jgi:hypothetical protein
MTSAWGCWGVLFSVPGAVTTSACAEAALRVFGLNSLFWVLKCAMMAKHKMLSKQPKNRIVGEVSGGDKAWEVVRCKLFITVWAKGWNFRKRLSRWLGGLIAFAIILEALNPFRAWLHNIIRRLEDWLLLIPLPPLPSRWLRWLLWLANTNGLRLTVELIFVGAVVVLFAQHYRLHRAVERHQALLDSLRSLSWMPLQNAAGGKEAAFTQFLASVLAMVSGTTTARGGWQYFWKKVLAWRPGGKLTDPPQVPTNYTKSGIITRDDATGTFKVTLPSSPPLDPDLLSLILPVRSAVGYAVNQRAVGDTASRDLFYIPSMRYKTGIRLEKRESDYKKEWDLNIEEEMPVHLEPDAAEAAGYRSALFTNIVKADGTVWGVLLLTVNKSMSCRLFHFDAIDFAAHLIEEAVNRIDFELPKKVDEVLIVDEAR